MEKASFRLESYRFVKAEIDFNIPKGTELSILFSPKGIFHSDSKLYELDFDVVVKCPEVDKDVVKVSCVANFSFDQIDTLGQIPDYFYPNSLAIMFPYIRAFVSTISLQANVQPIVLPTINLMGITTELKNNTVVNS